MINKLFKVTVKILLSVLLISGLTSCSELRALFSQNQTVPVQVSGSVQVVDGHPWFFHQVRQGQTLFSISRAYSVSQEQILKANPELENGLRAGQMIRIPAFSHNVMQGETAYGISRLYGLTEDELYLFNEGLKEQGVRAGQIISVPGSPDRRLVPDAQDTAQPEDLPATVSPSEPEIDRRALYPGRVSVREGHDMDAGTRHVALLIPLYLDEISARSETSPGSSFPSTVTDSELFRFISYYQGILLAVDSIRAMGANVTLHVFDVGQDLAQVSGVINSEDFQKMDLIIGPFFRRPLDVVAAWGRRYGIPVVSPLLADRNQLEGFPNLFNMVPSLEAQMTRMAGYIASSFGDARLILVHNNQPGALPVINVFRESLIRSMDESHNAGRDLQSAFGRLFPVRRETTDSLEPVPNVLHEVVYNQAGFQGLLEKMDPGSRNVIVTFIGGEAFLSAYARELSSIRHEYDIWLFGIPEWTTYISIDTDRLQQLNLHVFDPDYVDYTDKDIRNLVYKFRQSFNNEPDADAVRAVRTGMFFIQAMLQCGRELTDCMDELQSTARENMIDLIKPLGKPHGWENQHTHILRLQNFRQVDVLRGQ